MFSINTVMIKKQKSIFSNLLRLKSSKLILNKQNNKLIPVHAIFLISA